jgi:hypothetical protein
MRKLRAHVDPLPARHNDDKENPAADLKAQQSVGLLRSIRFLPVETEFHQCLA